MLYVPACVGILPVPTQMGCRSRDAVTATVGPPKPTGREPALLGAPKQLAWDGLDRADGKCHGSPVCEEYWEGGCESARGLEWEMGPGKLTGMNSPLERAVPSQGPGHTGDPEAVEASSCFFQALPQENHPILHPRPSHQASKRPG